MSLLNVAAEDATRPAPISTVDHVMPVRKPWRLPVVRVGQYTVRSIAATDPATANAKILAMMTFSRRLNIVVVMTMIAGIVASIQSVSAFKTPWRMFAAFKALLVPVHCPDNVFSA